MSDPAPPVPTHRMTSDEFIAWAMEQPKRTRYELEDGLIVTLSAERLAHAVVKGNVYAALRDGITRAGLPCIALPDGMAVAVSDRTTYEPDALVRCGAPLSTDTVKLTDPVIVVEVTSPSTSTRDSTAKLEDYFRLPSLHHYLIISLVRRALVHYARPRGAADIGVRILGDGPLRLDPPGLELDVAALFAGA